MGANWMSTVDSPSFDVISTDMHGDPVRCSYCPRPVKKVVVLPLTPLLAANSNSDDIWLGVCAYCVLAMAQAFQEAEGGAI